MDGFGQFTSQSQVDSALAAIPGMIADSNKVKILSRVSQYYYAVNPKKSFPYAEEALKLAEQLKWKRGIANLNNNLGLFISDTGNHVLARQHFQISYEINKELGVKVNLINNLNNIGRSYQFESAFPKATDYFFKALAIAEEIKNDDQLALVASNLASCFITQQDYEKGARYANMTLKHGTLAKNDRHIIKALMQLGSVKFHMNDSAGAISLYTSALRKAEQTTNKVDQSEILINLSVLYHPDYRKQLEAMLAVQNLLAQMNPDSRAMQVNTANMGDVYTNIASITTGKERTLMLQKAEECLSKSKQWAEITGPEERAMVYKMLSHLDEEKGNFQSALHYYKQSEDLNDSLFSQEQKNAIANLEGKHNLAIKDNEIALNKVLLTNQRKTQWGLVAGLGLFAVIGLLLFSQSRQRKKVNTTLMVLNTQLDEANKVKARFFSMLSHDLRSPIVNLVNFLHLQKNHPEMLDERQQANHAQSITDSAESLLNTMEAMLLWSKEQMDNFKPNIRSVAVQDLFAYLQDFYRQTARVRISFEHPGDLVVSSDENYLRTIMQNLTSNAINALKKTENPEIVWKAKAENGKTILSISDNGPGLAAEDAKALFDENIVNNNSKNGLGFHLIRDLAKAINYKLAVRSEFNTGTTFILSSVAA